MSNDAPKHVDLMVGNFNSIFKDVLNQWAPLRTRMVKNDIQPEWLKENIITKIKERDNAKKNGDHNLYKSLRNKVTGLIKQAKSSFYIEAITKAKGNNRILWKTLKSVTGSKPKETVSAIKINGKLSTDHKVIAESLNTYFTSIAEKCLQDLPKNNNKYKPSLSFTRFLHDKVPPTGFTIPHVTESYVLKALNNLNVKKATGIDGISAHYLKVAAPAIHKHICKIINESIDSGIFPDQWKCAKVYAVLKQGSASECDNYRPISILCILSKVIERHVHDCFYDYLVTYGLLCSSQSGFRKRYSCESSLLKLVNEWFTQMDSSNVIGSVTVYLRKAFDILNHDILVEKLTIYGCNYNTTRWFRSYISHRTQKVQHGVPQGSILGPLLFIIYLNDLTFDLEYVLTNMYADDSTFYLSGKSIVSIEPHIQSDMDILSKWYNVNKMVLNTDKSNCMLICKRNTLSEAKLHIHMNHQDLNNVTDTKILGVTVDQDLKWNLHIDNICKKLSRLSGLLWRIKSYLTFNAMVLFYNSYVLPCFQYCLSVWGNCLQIQPS